MNLNLNLIINLNWHFYLYILSMVLLVLIAFWNVSLLIDIILMQIQNEKWTQEAVRSNKNQATVSPNPDGGKDNRPWYKKKRYIIPIVIIVIGIGAWYYFSSGGDSSGTAAAVVNQVTAEQLENLIEIKNAKKSAINLIEICYGNLSNINIHEFNQLVSETLVNVIKYTPDNVPVLHAAIAHAHMIYAITESIRGAGVSLDTAHLVAQATIIGVTDGGVQELMQVTGASFYDAKIAYKQQIMIYGNKQRSLIDKRALAAYDLLPYTQVMGEKLATMQINMMSNALIEAKDTGIPVSLITERAVASSGEQTVKYVAAFGSITAAKIINGKAAAMLLTAKVTAYYAAQKATSIATIVALAGLIGGATSEAGIAGLAYVV